MSHEKKQESLIHAQEKAGDRNYISEGPDGRFNRKSLKVAIENLFKEPKETMLKDVKDCMMTMAD